MARSVCKSPGPGVADRFHHPPDRALEYCRTNCESRAVDAPAWHGQGFLTPTNAGLGSVQTFGLGSCDAGRKPEPGTQCRGKRGPPAGGFGIQVDGRPAGGSTPKPFGRGPAVFSFEARAPPAPAPPHI